MNRQEIRTRALLALHDSPTSPLAWSLQEMNQYLQEAQEVLAEEVEYVSRTLYLPLQAGVSLYPLKALQGSVMTPYRLWSRNRSHRLWSISIAELDGHDERWQTVQGEPEWWYPLSWEAFGLWPTPSTGGGTLEVDCYCWPQPLASDTDEPESSDPAHDLLLEHMLAQGQLKQWDVARALELLLPLSASFKDAQARAGLMQVQERSFSREDRQ